MSKSQLRNALLKFAPVFAFLAYGSWATWVNFHANAQNFIISGIIQGSYAFVSTLLLELTALKLFKMIAPKPQAKFITFIACQFLMIGIPILIHFLNHTKEIFYAILPGAVIGSVYLYFLLRYNTQSNNA